jgi:hypothetical protein
VSTVCVDVASWDVDWDTGVVSYDVTVSGQRRSVPCSVHLLGTAGSLAPPYPLALGSKSVPVGSDSYSVPFTRKPSVMREVTEIQAVLKEAASGQIVAESPVVTVSEGNPVPGAWLTVRKWARDPATGEVAFEFTIHGRGLAGAGNVFEFSGRWEVAGVTASGSKVVLASSGKLSNAWYLQATLTSPAKQLPELSHLCYTIESASGSPPPIVRQYPLPDVSQDPSQHIASDFQIAPYVTALDGVPLDRVCSLVAQLSPSSVVGTGPSDAFLVCEEARVAGLPLPLILAKVVEVAVGGPAVLDGMLVILGLNDKPSAEGPAPAPGASEIALGQAMQGEART